MNTRKVTREMNEAEKAAQAALLALPPTGVSPIKTGLNGGNKPPVTTSKVTLAKAAPQAAVKPGGAVKAGGGGTGKGAAKPSPVSAASVVAPLTPVSVVVAKPKAAGKRETLLAMPELVEGHNLAKFGVGFDGKPLAWRDQVPVPTRADILAARALRRGKGACSGAELSLACMLALTGRHISIEGVGNALVMTSHGGGGVRQNVVRDVISLGLAGYINPADGTFTGTDKTVFKLPNHFNSGFSRCAAVRPTSDGLNLIAAALGGIENVPDYMRFTNAEIDALKVTADKKAARKAAAAVKAPTKRK